MRLADSKTARTRNSAAYNSRGQVNARLVTVETKDDKQNNQRCLYFDRTFSEQEFKIIGDIERHQKIEELQKEIQHKEKEIETIGDVTKVTALQIMRQQIHIEPPQV